MKATKILTVLTLILLVCSLVACNDAGKDKTNDGDRKKEIASLMAMEPKSMEEAPCLKILFQTCSFSVSVSAAVVFSLFAGSFFSASPAGQPSSFPLQKPYRDTGGFGYTLFLEARNTDRSGRAERAVLPSVLQVAVPARCILCTAQQGIASRNESG